MLKVNIMGAGAFEKRLEDMAEQLKKLGTQDIGAELKEWQSADMHRKRPKTRVSKRGKRASTIIRPHSVAEMKRSHRVLLRAKRRKAGIAALKRFSTRPILRNELYEKFTERMRALLASVKW